MALARAITLALRFLTELAALFAFTLWGFHESGWFGVLPPIAAAAFWARFIAPRASHRLEDPRRLTLEIAYFALATAAFAQVGSDAAAFAGGATAVGVAVLERVLHAEAPVTSARL